MRSWLWLVAIAACGHSSSARNDASNNGSVDAPKDASSNAQDAAIDAPIMATGSHTHYVINQENVPSTNAQVNLYGLSLNNSGTVTNQLGQVFATLAGMGIDVQGTTTTAINTGVINLLADVQTTSFTDATATGFTTYLGSNPMPPACNGSSDTTCGHQLTGGATFTVPAASPHDPELTGVAQSGTFVQGPGLLSIQLAIASPTMPVELDMIGARAKLVSVSATGIASGVLAGGLTPAEVDASFIPAFTASMVTIVQKDCCGTPTSPQPTCNYNATPSCGCTQGSTGATLLSLFDTAHACTVTVTEVETNSLIQDLLSPDITVSGVDALSFGVGITAVGAVYTP